MRGRFGLMRLLAASILVLGHGTAATPTLVLASVVPVSWATQRLSTQRSQALQTAPLKVATTVFKSGALTCVQGTVTNENSYAVNYPQVSITLKDAGGTAVGNYTGIAGGYRAGPGEKLPFGRTFDVFTSDASQLTAIVTATAYREFEPLPVTLAEVETSYAPSGGLRLYKSTFRNDSPYAVEGPTVAGWELDASGGLIDTFFAHDWVVIPPGGIFRTTYTGFASFALPASVKVWCQARPLGIASPTVTIAGVPTGWSRSNVTFTLTSSDAASRPYYRIGGIGAELVPYVAPVTISSEGRTTVEYTSVNGGLQGPIATAVVAIDKTAPRTVSNTRSSYRGSATITLTPRDSVSGVLDTRYRVDSGTWRAGTRVIVRSLGRHTLRFYSRDKAGNAEQVRTASFTITR